VSWPRDTSFRKASKPLLLFGKLKTTESARAVAVRRMTTLLQRPDRCQYCGVRAVQPPLVPAHAVETIAKINGAIPFVGTQRADALELAIEERLVSRQLVMIDLQHIHAAKQEAGIMRAASPFWHFTAWRRIDDEFCHLPSPFTRIFAFAFYPADRKAD
jgi:hypothetical protein